MQIKILSLLIVLYSSVCYAGGWYYGAVDVSAPTYLFEADFETDGMISWDITPGTEDCDGYDADGDWCDYDTTQYAEGSHSLGIRGAYTNQYMEKTVTGSSTEFYIDYWTRFDALTSSNYNIRVEDSSNAYDLSVLVFTNGALYVYYNASAANEVSSASLISADTWYHIGIYYKQETTPGSSGDGVMRVYVRSDATAFSYSDVEIEATDLTTGTVDADSILFRAPNTGLTQWYDDVIMDSGDPGWPTS